MYWLIECNPETGLETNRFKYKFLAQKEMKRRHREHSTAERVSSYICEFEAMVNTGIGTYEWKIVGEGNDHDGILKKIEDKLGEDYLLSEEMTEFYVEHWYDCECPTDIDDYAYLNTIFGYDIGSENAKKISTWLYEKFDIAVMDIPEGGDSDNLMRVAKWDLGLNLDFSNFSVDIEAIRYDW